MWRSFINKHDTNHTNKDKSKNHKFTVSEGDDVYFNYKNNDGIFLLHNGAIKLSTVLSAKRGRTTSHEYITKIVSAGEYFGLKMLMLADKRERRTDQDYRLTPSRAISLSNSEVEFFPIEMIQNHLQNSDSIICDILYQSVSDFFNKNKSMQMNFLASVQERIIMMLVQMAQRFGEKTKDGIEINLKLSRAEMAQLASTINESLSRHLSELKSEGLLDVQGKKIIIKDLAKLKEKMFS